MAFESLKSQFAILHTGTADNVLDNKWYNSGIQNLIIFLIMFYTGYMSVEHFSVDTTGLSALVGLVFGIAVFVGFIGALAATGHKQDGALGVLIAIGFGFLVILEGSYVEGVEDALDKMSNGLVSVNYSIDQGFILTAETLASIGIFLFALQCRQVAKDNDHSVLKRPLGTTAILFFSSLIIAKPIFGFMGGTYPSFSIFALMTIFIFSIQKYLLFYIDSRELVLSNELLNVDDEIEGSSDGIGDIFDWASFVSIITLISLMDMPFVFLVLSLLYLGISIVMIGFKSIYNNIATIGISIFAALYAIAYMLIEFFSRAVYFFDTQDLESYGVISLILLFGAFAPFFLGDNFFVNWLKGKMIKTATSSFALITAIMLLDIITTPVPDSYKTKKINTTLSQPTPTPTNSSSVPAPTNTNPAPTITPKLSDTSSDPKTKNQIYNDDLSEAINSYPIADIISNTKKPNNSAIADAKKTCPKCTDEELDIIINWQSKSD